MDISPLITQYFSPAGESFCNNATRFTSSLLDCFDVNTSKIAQSMAKLFKLTAAAATKCVQRTLNSDLQLNDKFWRLYNDMLFAFFEEKMQLKAGDTLQINVDFTSNEDKHLVLMASLVVNGEKAVMLYFSMRNYPKKKGQLDQKKMEHAFFTQLEHFLPKKYKYVIVADRGFGHERIIELCEKLGFSFVLRRTEDINVVVNGEKRRLNDFAGQDCFFEAEVPAWKHRKVNFAVNTVKSAETGETSTWYIMYNKLGENARQIYEKRFKIEKLFQDFKKNGFNLESSKLKSYSRVKRMIFFIGLAHAITTFAGLFAKNPYL
jgi:hypothetical protein